MRNGGFISIQTLNWDAYSDSGYPHSRGTGGALYHES